MSETHEVDIGLLQQIARCPNDEGELEARVSGGAGLLRCESCRRLFPVEDGIAILLPDGKRNPRFEIPLLERSGRQHMGEGWSAELRETMAVVRSVEPSIVWEWQDVAFWDRCYEERLTIDEPTDPTYRLQQRRRAVEIAFDGLEPYPTILDVGAGEGQTTAGLVPHIFADSTYIALDMSFHGLRLNRSLHWPGRGLYLLASADDPPLADGLADVVTFYGILHHCEQKAVSLLRYRSKVKTSGRMLLAEGVARPRATPRLIRRWVPYREESAHEERIPIASLREVLRQCGTVAYYRQYFTPLYGLLSRLSVTRKLLLSNGRVHAAALACDDVLSRTLGAVIPVFGPGEVIAVVARSDDAGARGCDVRTPQRKDTQGDTA